MAETENTVQSVPNSLYTDTEVPTYVPFIFDINSTQAEMFETVEDFFKYLFEENVYKRPYSVVSDTVSVLSQPGEGLPDYFAKSLMTDTRLGWNDGINTLWQFNKDDDIMYPIHQSTKNTGLGRVYYETIQKHQRILYLSFGVPQFNNIIDFYSSSFSIAIANLMRNGVDDSFISSIASIAGQTFGLAFKVPFLPLIWLNNLAQIRSTFTISKYFEFKSTMPLYFAAVTGMLTKIAANMGFAPGLVPSNNEKYNEYLQKASPLFIKAMNKTTDLFTIMTQRAMARSALFAPSIIAEDSFDLFYKLNLDKVTNEKEAEKKSNLTYGNYSVLREIKIAAKEEGVTDAMSKWYTHPDVNENLGREAFLDAVKVTALGGMHFIGFRIDKSMDASESFSNSLGPSAISQKLNAKVQESRETVFTFMQGQTGKALLDVPFNLATNFISSALETLNLDALLNVYTGDSFIDIPEIWQSSSFSRSYSFNMSLRSPYGDPVSIFQSIYTPFCMVLAASLPRATGDTSYTSPFLLRAYCRGMFSVPLGMIESLTVQRGSSEFGWNISHLPLSMDLSISIRDLSPAMYFGVPGGNGIISTVKNVFSSAFQVNSSFNDYMETLAGVGLSEKILIFQTLSRRYSALMRTLRNTVGNIYYWSNHLGNASIPMLLGNFSPYNTFPTS